MRAVLMCPKCGELRFVEENDHSCDICEYCGTKRKDVNETVDSSQINYDSDREIFEQRMYRKYLYSNPLFDEVTLEQRIKGERDFREEIRQNVAKLPKCPICQSTNLSKISTASKVGKIAMFGIFGMGDNGKTWKCDNCGTKF